MTPLDTTVEQSPVTTAKDANTLEQTSQPFSTSESNPLSLKFPGKDC